MKRLLCALLTLGLLGGCAGPRPNGTSDVPMGRYVEQEGVQLDSLNWVSDFQQGEDGTLGFYGSTNTGIKRYELDSTGSTVTEGVEPWLNQLSEEGLIISQVSSGPNGSAYALCNAPNDGNRLYRTIDNGQTSQLIPMEGWIPESQAEEQSIPADGTSISVASGGMMAMGTVYHSGGMSQSQYPQAVHTLDDGGFLIAYGERGVCRYSADGIKTAEFPGTAFRGGSVLFDETLLVRTPDGTGLWQYNLENTVQSDASSYDGMSYLTKIGMDTNGLYLADSTGIYRQNTGGSLWERLVDGDLTSLSMPDQNLMDLTPDGTSGFWAILGGEHSARIVHYVYSGETPTNPDTELTIFGLSDNATIRQTIGEFQRRNPTVRINFRVAQSGDSSATTEDIIRALNTEILSGKAPDLLLLDGLPVDSYMEKGVLLDLTDHIKTVSQSQGLLEQLLNAYEKDGRLYGVSSRFSFPIMLGQVEQLAEVTSLEALSNLVTAKQGDTIPFLHAPSSLWQDNGMLLNYYGACVGSWSNGRTVDQTALSKYLGQMLTLNQTVRDHAPQLGAGMAMVTMAISTGKGSGFELVNMGPLSVAQGEAQIHIQELAGKMNLDNLIDQLSGKEAYRLDTLFGGSAYTPLGGIGVVASGTQQALATAFVELLLSETVQDKYLYDGLPVNGRSLDRMIAENLEGRDDLGLSQLCRTLDTPVQIDRVLKEAVEAQAKSLLDGSMTPAQAAEQIANMTELYRAE